MRLAGLTDLVLLAFIVHDLVVSSARKSHLQVGRATDCGRAGNDLPDTGQKFISKMEGWG